MEAHEKLQQPIEKAMSLFWTQGVDNTSYPDLVTATGMSRKALYSAWPDKTALVYDTLDYYRETVLGPILAQLDLPGMAGLEHFWAFMETGIASTDYYGCFLFRSAGGDLRNDKHVTNALSSHLNLLKSKFSAAFEQAVTDEDLPNDFDIELAVWQVVSILTTISSFGGSKPMSDDIPSLIDAGRKTCGIK